MSTTEQTSGGQHLKLMVEDDEGVKASYPILLPELTVGRSPESAVCLPQRDISRQHAHLRLQEQRGARGGDGDATGRGRRRREDEGRGRVDGRCRLRWRD